MQNAVFQVFDNVNGLELQPSLGLIFVITLKFLRI